MDIDGDGIKDIISGCYASPEREPMAGQLYTLRGHSGGKFGLPRTIKGTDGNPLVITRDSKRMTDAICTRPFAVDWNQDGRLDLVVGTFSGHFFVFEGKGQGEFAPEARRIKVPQKTTTDPMAEYSICHGDPFVIDWDGDGDLDLLTGSAGAGVRLAENTAGPHKPPELKAWTTLIPASKTRYGSKASDVPEPGEEWRIWVADFNGDGKLDILVGDRMNVLMPAKGIAEADFEQRFSKWDATLKRLESDLKQPNQDPDRKQEITDRLNAHFRECSSFAKEKNVGFIWVYLQK